MSFAYERESAWRLLAGRRASAEASGGGRPVGFLVVTLRDARFTSVILRVGVFETLMCYCTSVEVQIVFAYPRPVGPVE